MIKFYNMCANLVDFTDMALPPRDQRHQYLRFEVLQYTEADIADFETRLARIYKREVHRVQVFDFGGLPDLMTVGLSSRMLKEHWDAQGQRGARRCMSWRQFILALGLHTAEEMESVGFDAYWAVSTRQIPDKGDLRDYWIWILSTRDFLGTTPIQAPKKGAMIFGGQYVACLAKNFGLLTEERLQALTVIVRELPVIDLAKLVRLQICVDLDDT
ncbi:hypothetical protein Tco_0222712 [Tanacetum coccineum]